MSNPTDSSVCGKSKSCPFNLKESKSPLPIFTTSAGSVSHRSLAKDFNKIFCMVTFNVQVFLLKSRDDTLRYSIYRIKVDSFVMVFGSFREVVGVLFSKFVPDWRWILNGLSLCSSFAPKDPSPKKD